MNRNNQRKIRSFFKLLLGIIGSIAVLGYISAIPQDQEVVTVKKTCVSFDGVIPGQSIQAAIVVDVIPGWHIHGNDPGDEFLIPTIIVFDDDENLKDVEVFYPEPLKEKYGYADAELLVYEGEIYFGVNFEIQANIPMGDYTVNGKFKFQACDDSSCLPPSGLEFEISFRVVDPSQEIKPINEDVFENIKFDEKEIQ